ncbi:MAG: hypothetical protein PF569_05255 [Candidatus Woesearchaeota archaeon]|jgi:hypothetical protein|nr:hypothetical protein [Candidatus Woesearchaeota archaeon]
MFRKKEKELREHKVSLENGLKSIGPFLNLMSFTGTIYFISKDFHSIQRNYSTTSSKDLNKDNLPLIKNDSKLEKFIKKKSNQYSCKGFITLDQETSNHFYENFAKSKIMCGVPIGQTSEGEPISYWLYLRESIIQDSK